MSLLICLTGCANGRFAFEQAARDKARAEASVRVIEVAKKLPPQPADCRKQEASGIVVGDRLDVAVVKADAARKRANARVKRCAGWYDDLREGFAR